jgi:hypothetical protein
MNTLKARFLQPAPLAFATLIAALSVFMLTLALSAAFGASHDVEPLVGPFRWQPTDSFMA